ncbi:MAG TPA: acyl-CoA dehydrogenase family protein [Mycobacteriales bacterium]|nr:acyl-CoA dehydrogenase family protein [Mycobacteriales bacterium]
MPLIERLAGLPALTAALAADAARHDADGSYPAEGIAAVHRSGLLTATVAQQHGGAGAGLAETTRILHALGRGDPSVALICAMTLIVHGGQSRAQEWSEPAYRMVLEDLAAHSGPPLINHIRVEPDLGTPSRGGRQGTTATAIPDGWSISGRKTFCTGSEGLRWLIVSAGTDEETPRAGTFLVRADAPGITLERTWDHLGLRASSSHDLILTDVRVPPEAVISRPGDGAARPDPRHQAWNCLGLSALYLGVARAAQDWLGRFLHDRVPGSLGAPLATLPRFQALAGEIEASLLGAEGLVRALAERYDAAGDVTAAEVTGAKLIANRAAIGAVEQALGAVGNPGLTRHNPLQRHYRDVLCSRVHFPQDDVITGTIGRAALDRSAT